eukprot:CAMPEP_0184489690 /NCGR_PEP_ID=MMETSP0113_2-20130426/16142_1 /TAXON_ID=91329 /ORGANISM="Norrisiella sphaerica, Strain BC52" /LENGTH=133 /DNA_ID=CAMNT_0026873261 /DNA_START=326 /DNA_END=727 /DNA_ORIENTATION=+
MSPGKGSFRKSRDSMKVKDWDGVYEYAEGGPWFWEVGDQIYKIRRFTPRNTPWWWFDGGKGEAIMRFQFAEAEPWFTQPAYEGQDWNETYWGAERKTPDWFFKILDILPTFIPFVLYFTCIYPNAYKYFNPPK